VACCNGNDRAFIRIDGKRVYLGQYGSPESRQQYAELINANPSENVPLINAPPTINEMLVMFLEYAQDYYRSADGEISREYSSLCEVTKILRYEASRELAQDFGPKRLKAIHETMIGKAGPANSLTTRSNPQNL